MLPPLGYGRSFGVTVPAVRDLNRRVRLHRPDPVTIETRFVGCDAWRSDDHIVEGVNGMGKGRKIVALALAIAALAVTLGAPAASAGPNCSPGQHGNPHPGFKPGSC